ncbi:MAG TPA: acetate kinase, partial [Candidatus Polarisedimenticolia bacterium]|nr:acetate kinase [Candidatus Polarisedimenticolia bacterium]
MNVLALNCGSSSVRFQVVGFDEGGAAGSRGRRVAGGLVERIGAASRLIARAGNGPSIDEPAGAPDHGSAVRRAINWLTTCGAPIDAIGHRVVHGGSKYFRSTLLDAAVESAIEELEDLAPMHNAPCLAGIRAARNALARDIPMAAVFDTGFHADLPPRAGRYGIPKELAVRHGIRRFGFHGIAYRYVLQRY